MHRRPLIWQLFPSYLLVTLVALAAVTFYTSRSVREFYMEQMQSDLAARVQLVSVQAMPMLALTHDPAQLQADMVALAEVAGIRLTLVANDGQVLADSGGAPGQMENHGARSEIVAATKSGQGESLRLSPTLNARMLYFAVALKEGDQTLGVLRGGVPADVVESGLFQIYLRIVAGGLIIAILAGIMSWVVSRRIIRPLDVMKRGAQRFARGDLEQRLPVPETLEFASLSDALNKMAAQLNERIKKAVQQRNEQEAVLSSMVESVIAVDNYGRVISINHAAARLLSLDPTRAVGQDIQLLVRNTALQQFIQRTLDSPGPVEGEVTVHGHGEQILQAHGAILNDSNKDAIGAVIVLNDITRLRRLEQVRRDFVANVSHELKTPITSIKGFVETLLEAGPDSKEESERFLRIVARQAERLHRIIDDLLTLSSIEQYESVSEEFLERTSIERVVRASVQHCADAADRKDIDIEVTCSSGLKAQINPHLLEQGIVNLVDNAIKYSDSGSSVKVEALETERDVQIRVRDKGCGVSSDHLPRLFERFYRVDKARSRSVGGTGLGLAIVKHIAQSHGGRVTVTSTPGEGSIFTIHLPLSNPARLPISRA